MVLLVSLEINMPISLWKLASLSTAMVPWPLSTAIVKTHYTQSRKWKHHFSIPLWIVKFLQRNCFYQAPYTVSFSAFAAMIVHSLLLSSYLHKISR